MENLGKEHTLLEKILRVIERFIPRQIYRTAQPLYHYLLSIGGALLYWFPARKLTVIAVTGTKGKTSTAELVNAILEAEGYTTALVSTLRCKIGDHSERNMYKMTLRGRFFLQRLLRNAVAKGCTHAVIEITSEAAAQYRHKFLSLDALIFTNISPEHIESHGSFENYLNAKLSIARELHRSPKKKKVLVANIDDEHGNDFFEVAPHATAIPFSSQDAACTATKGGITLKHKRGEIHSLLEGSFNCMNILAAVAYAESQTIPFTAIQKGIESVSVIKGRVEHIDEGQLFDVVVDYAHTPDSLTKLYETFPHQKKICVLGNTGGGRDAWKRPEMGRIAEKYCETVILTNEDPYNEPPEQIITDMAKGMKTEPIIVIDRRKAIREALIRATHLKNALVLISGKGTDPYIMGPNNTKEPWSDEAVVREELHSLNK